MRTKNIIILGDNSANNQNSINKLIFPFEICPRCKSKDTSWKPKYMFDASRMCNKCKLEWDPRKVKSPKKNETTKAIEKHTKKTINCSAKIDDKKLWSRVDFIFAKENNKYKVLKHRDGNMGLCSKQDIIKYIFS